MTCPSTDESPCCAHTQTGSQVTGHVRSPDVHSIGRAPVASLASPPWPSPSQCTTECTCVLSRVGWGFLMPSPVSCCDASRAKSAREASQGKNSTNISINHYTLPGERRSERTACM